MCLVPTSSPRKLVLVCISSSNTTDVAKTSGVTLAVERKGAKEYSATLNYELTPGKASHLCYAAAVLCSMYTLDGL